MGKEFFFIRKTRAYYFLELRTKNPPNQVKRWNVKVLCCKGSIIGWYSIPFSWLVEILELTKCRTKCSSILKSLSLSQRLSWFRPVYLMLVMRTRMVKSQYQNGFQCGQGHLYTLILFTYYINISYSIFYHS